MFSPSVWWVGSTLNLSGSDVQILQMYSNGMNATRRSSGFLVTACRIRSAACVTLSRFCARRVFWPSELPLTAALGSICSVGRFRPLFAGFPATMAASDFFRSFISVYGVPPLHCGPARLPTVCTHLFPTAEVCRLPCDKPDALISKTPFS